MRRRQVHGQGLDVVEGAVDPVADPQPVGLGLEVDVRSPVAEPLGEQQVDDLHHRGIDLDGGRLTLGDLGPLAGRLRDRVLDPVEELVVAVERSLQGPASGEPQDHRLADGVPDRLLLLLVAGVGDRAVDPAHLVDEEREGGEAARLGGVEPQERLLLGGDAVEVDGVEAELVREGGDDVVLLEPSVDEQLPDRALLATLAVERLLDRLGVGGAAAHEQLAQRLAAGGGPPFGGLLRRFASSRDQRHRDLSVIWCTTFPVVAIFRRAPSRLRDPGAPQLPGHPGYRGPAGLPPRPGPRLSDHGILQAPLHAPRGGWRPLRRGY